MNLNILGEKVTVYLKSQEEMEEEKGECKFGLKEIWICDSLKDEEYRHTLIHEVVHWALYRSGLAEGMTGDFGKILNEGICDSISFVLVDNEDKLF